MIATVTVSAMCPRYARAGRTTLYIIRIHVIKTFHHLTRIADGAPYRRLLVRCPCKMDVSITLSKYCFLPHGCRPGCTKIAYCHRTSTLALRELPYTRRSRLLQNSLEPVCTSQTRQSNVNGTQYRRARLVTSLLS